MHLYFATGNAGKVDDARSILADADVTVEQLEVDATEPSDATLAEIATAKVQDAWTQSRKQDAYLMADDSGLFVDALDGFPGQHSAFFDAKVGKEKLLRLLDEDDPRTASFRAAIALYVPDTRAVETFTGRVDGRLVEPRGDGGFGYDPMFQPDGHEKTFAEDMDYKHAVSHRRQALQALRDWLRQRDT